jgi:DNA-binding response OmpR family regulator
VVVIDDHVDTADSIAFFLEAKGIKTKKAYSGKKGLNL